MTELTPGEIVRLVRITLKKDQTEFAELLDCNPNHLSMVENGLRQVSVGMAMKIRSLDENYSLDDLLKR